MKNVQKEHHRTKTIIIEDTCKTRWGSKHKEIRRASINQKDLEVSFDCMINPAGMDKELYNKHRNNLSVIMSRREDWLLYQQFEGAMQPLYQYILSAKNAQVVVHRELFKGRMCLERLAAPHFPMYENLSVDVTGPRSNNLTAHRLDQLVVKDNFVTDNELSKRYRRSMR